MKFLIYHNIHPFLYPDNHPGSALVTIRERESEKGGYEKRKNEKEKKITAFLSP
ncbi:MAG: hypothetical protein WCF90_03590 [Methanomicrobiales archaeon]